MATNQHDDEPSAAFLRGLAAGRTIGRTARGRENKRHRQIRKNATDLRATIGETGGGKIEIYETNGRGVGGEFVVALHVGGAAWAYLHTDRAWRSTRISKIGATGYFPTRATASEALADWIATLPYVGV